MRKEFTSCESPSVLPQCRFYNEVKPSSVVSDKDPWNSHSTESLPFHHLHENLPSTRNTNELVDMLPSRPRIMSDQMLLQVKFSNLMLTSVSVTFEGAMTNSTIEELVARKRILIMTIFEKKTLTDCWNYIKQQFIPPGVLKISPCQICPNDLYRTVCGNYSLSSLEPTAKYRFVISLSSLPSGQGLNQVEGVFETTLDGDDSMNGGGNGNGKVENLEMASMHDFFGAFVGEAILMSRAGRCLHILLMQYVS